MTGYPRKIKTLQVVDLPLRKRWSEFTEENIAREGDAFGCYELADSHHTIVYIGQGRIVDRLNAHWRDVENKPRISYYRCVYYGSKYRAEQMERVELGAYEHRHGKLPRYNRQGWINPRYY